MSQPGELTWNWRAIMAVFSLVILGILVLSWKLRPTVDKTDVLVVGDSVTYLSAGLIQNQFDRNHLQFVAKPGYPSSDLLPLVLEAMDQGGSPASQRETIALLVGYNDVRVRRIDTPALPALVRAASEFECAVFLTLPARPGGVANPDALVPSEIVEAWNIRLAAEVEKYPNVHLAKDWEDVVTRAPAEVMLEADTLHPSDAGKRRLAHAYRSAVDRRCPPPPTGEDE